MKNGGWRVEPLPLPSASHPTAPRGTWGTTPPPRRLSLTGPPPVLPVGIGGGIGGVEGELGPEPRRHRGREPGGSAPGFLVSPARDPPKRESGVTPPPGEGSREGPGGGGIPNLPRSLILFDRGSAT